MEYGATTGCRQRSRTGGNHPEPDAITPAEHAEDHRLAQELSDDVAGIRTDRLADADLPVRSALTPT